MGPKGDQMAKTIKAVTASEHKIDEFAEDLGRLLGSATAKADKWLGQRQQIVKHLTEVRDTASKLLSDLGHKVAEVPFPRMLGKRRGRPVGSKNQNTEIIFVGGRTGKTPSTGTTTVVNKIRDMATEPVVRQRRKMSAKGRKAISMAQKVRWARQKAGNKKS